MTDSIMVFLCSASLFYCRDKENKEIDLLIYQNGTLYLIEIKKTAAPGKDAIKNFGALNSVTYPVRWFAW